MFFHRKFFILCSVTGATATFSFSPFCKVVYSHYYELGLAFPQRLVVVGYPEYLFGQSPTPRVIATNSLVYFTHDLCTRFSWLQFCLSVGPFVPNTFGLDLPIRPLAPPDIYLGSECLANLVLQWVLPGHSPEMWLFWPIAVLPRSVVWNLFSSGLVVALDLLHWKPYSSWTSEIGRGHPFSASAGGMLSKASTMVTGLFTPSGLTSGVTSSKSAPE
ncbi:hypothetical protein Acr_00g0047790 [Actinidia rufa]|uniref:Uncharacterized protein n=1 Tax=Actinidia rufa TaxID=165716 RepID=A0A7J0DJU6_9ERIC|nr:hypothetical protein Acr_00g0047790 [Actinidia rufa]